MDFVAAKLPNLNNSKFLKVLEYELLSKFNVIVQAYGYYINFSGVFKSNFKTGTLKKPQVCGPFETYVDITKAWKKYMNCKICIMKSCSSLITSLDITDTVLV